MKVQMRNAVAGVATDVEYEAVSAFHEPVGLRDPIRDFEHLDEHVRVFSGDVSRIDDVLFRDDEDMCGRNGVQVPEGVDETGGKNLG